MKKLNVLITGAGGPAAICAYKSLRKGNYKIHMADMDPLSAGLYLVKKKKRHIILPAKNKSFVDHLVQICASNKINILIPTVDMELIQLAEARQLFEAVGTKVLVADKDVLTTIMNKYSLLNTLSKSIDVGSFDMLDKANATNWNNKKVVIKPVSGSGSRGVEFYENFKAIPAQKFDQQDLMIQAFIEGPEYSIDVMVGQNGQVKAIVPRLRMRTDSGVSVTGKVVNELTYAANIQVILSPEFGPQLVEINPRFSGGLSLVIEAGADTPLMAVKEIMGETVEPISKFKELAMVRTYTEVFMEGSNLLS